MVFKEVLVQLLSKATSIPAHQHALCYVPAEELLILREAFPVWPTAVPCLISAPCQEID